VSTFTLVPIVAVSLVAVASVLVVPRVHPATAARLLTLLTAVASLAAVTWCSVMAAAHLVATWPALLPHAALAGFILDYGPVPAWLGWSTVAVLAWGSTSVAWLAGRVLRERGAVPPGEGVVVVERDDVVAFAVPGRRPRVVVSAGLLSRLHPDELAVVLAHEQAHLRHRHHLYALATFVAGRFAPWLLPATRLARFSLERWADEDAARQLGDRRLVARAISRAALHQRTTLSSAFGGHGVARRAELMLAAPPALPDVRHAWAVTTSTVSSAVVANSGLDLHHVLMHL
jgi:Zn-dependent protease with chaperone function